MPQPNKALILSKVPNGAPVPGTDLTVEQREIDLDQQLPPDSVLTKNLYASLDPYMRGRMRDPSIKSYSPPYQVGEPITAYSIGQVLRSENPKYKKGDIIWCILKIEEYSVVTKEELAWPQTQKIDVKPGLSLSHYAGILGMTGLTAYSSLYEIGQPKKGETIFISSAAGAVGQVVGQLAKHEGLKVIGSVGDDDKLRFITEELGFDAGFNYKKEKPGDALARLAPNGIDIYYENVGGEHLEAALNAMNPFGRIIACGMVSQYNLKPEEAFGVKNLMLVVGKRIRMQGFIVGDENMGPKYAKERNERVSAWLLDGSIKTKEDITTGIENGPEALVSMLRGGNRGKAILKIADPE
ncbi:putative zinc-type alcohol dehydrogenase-like protein PB24D3.08c [Aspergillus japonicus CBS 114.51]|uniref:Putative zinc-type alcohol dehydrogenase-like protein PB24D3.08c n=2 Tax=Aspergillus TaxID=5052 RepID=A0A2V5H364_ASPV1|nr:putative zinc-type alcohol dehydrogenase-like protein PB24D3.08c [Aspergillus japonicus CBS 114.51]PYI18021.1 putative zinc-type alcohol dehydrogenase-like protein PB24D3.08c [Aspergillus violaceofuscus CBS 115571]RAH79334.1 putative zinc-type alcohol dehydrogenase-like protein PB24D3.08c [Aspergillus japonicus CBS 114.51]